MVDSQNPERSGQAEPTPWPLVRSDYTLRLRTHLPSNQMALKQAIKDVLRLAGQCGCMGEHRADLEIALGEALANAIVHGNELQDAKRIFLRCYGAPHESLLIVVRDEGPGFDPQEVPDPREDDRRYLNHGRGLLLMRELMDYVEHRKSGREVLLYKSCGRKREPDAPLESIRE